MGIPQFTYPSYCWWTFGSLDCCLQPGIILTTAAMSIPEVSVGTHSYAFLLGTYVKAELLGKYAYEHAQL